MSNHQTSKDLHSAIFLRESEDGAEPYNSQDGVQTDLFGQEVLPVNPSQQQGKEKEKMTSDISGQSSLISSESANLQQSLENKLQRLSDMGGSTIYKLTLRKKDTPQGRSYFQLAASAPRIKENDSSSWPTPTAATGGASKNPNNKRGINGGNPMATAASLVPWLTPTTSDMNGVRELDGKRSGGLNTQAQTAWPTPMQTDGSKACNRYRENHQNGLGAIASTVDSWATPTTRDYKCTGNMENYIFGSPTGRIRTDSVPTQAYLIIAPWATPTATDPTRGTKPPRPHDTGIPLTQQVSGLNPWATPNTMDHMALRSDEALLRQATVARKGRTFPANLREQVDPRSQEIYASGTIPPPSTAETEKTVPSQLNPRFSLWLMGYPIEWAYSGERVTPLSRKRRQKS